eukprot:Opistho-2@73630
MHSDRVWPRAIFWRNWVGLFILGTVNNIAYVIVNSAAESVSESFNAKNLLGFIPWANVAFGFLSRSLNTLFLQNSRYSLRMIGNSIAMAAGLLGLAFAPNFPFALAAVALVGMACSFGESVVLGYLKLFPPELVNGWSSGTGMAGVGGAGLYLAYNGAGLSDKVSFLLTLPFIALYLIGFFIVIKIPADSSYGSTDKKGEPTERTRLLGTEGVDAHLAESASTSVESVTVKVGRGQSSADASRVPLLGDSYDPYQDDGAIAVDDGVAAPTTAPQATQTPYQKETGSIELAAGVVETEEIAATESLETSDETTVQRYIRCIKLGGWLSFNLAAVYFFEYVVSGGCAAKVITEDEKNSGDWWRRHAYEIFSLCYQIGVFISRSSLQLFKIERVEILTVLQGINFAFWVAEARYKFIPAQYDVWILFPLMIYVGLLGGASYVNVFYLLLNKEDIPQKDRELCINLSAIAINFGITFGCAYILLQDNTYLHDV